MLNQSIPKYQNVYSEIKNFISTNKWPIGEIIPSEHELVDFFKVSRITIRSALNLLENDGLIVRKRGKGTLVKSSFNENDGCFESLTEKIIANGDSPSSSILEFKKIINQKNTKHFASGTQLYFVKRLRKVNGKPYLISNAFLNYKLCFGLNKNYFTEEGSSQSIIYILKNNFGINFTENSQYICAKELSVNDSDALNKSPGIPCLSQECLLYNNDNQLVLVDQNITFNTLMFNSKS
jgi:DNA-binding GntR family transcriptional regulator